MRHQTRNNQEGQGCSEVQTGNSDGPEVSKQRGTKAVDDFDTKNNKAERPADEDHISHGVFLEDLDLLVDGSLIFF